MHGESFLDVQTKVRSGTPFVLIVWLVKEEICRQFFVLVAGKICLDDHVPLEAQTAELLMSVRCYLAISGRI